MSLSTLQEETEEVRNLHITHLKIHLPVSEIVSLKVIKKTLQVCTSSTGQAINTS